METKEAASIMGIPYYKTRLSLKKIVWCRSTLILLGTGSPRVLGYLVTGVTGSSGEASHLLGVVSWLDLD